MNETQPWFLARSGYIVPINVDITYFGARYVDAFCWDTTSSYTSPDEFAAQTCYDKDLPTGFRLRIALQIKEQLEAYEDILQAAKFSADLNEDFLNLFKIPLNIPLCVRKGTIEYKDNVAWSLTSPTLTPEQFAVITQKDLSLPFEMGPIIAFKIRESLFRHLIGCLDGNSVDLFKIQLDQNKRGSEDTVMFGQTDIPTVSLIPPLDFVDMVTSLSKKMKPTSVSIAGVALPHALLPSDTRSNKNVWLSTDPPKQAILGHTENSSYAINDYVSSCESKDQ